jgi:hypothetical protein
MTENFMTCQNRGKSHENKGQCQGLLSLFNLHIGYMKYTKKHKQQYHLYNFKHMIF